MSKITNSSKKPDDESVKTTWWDECTMFYPIRQVPINDAWLDKLADELIEWVKSPKALLVDQFWVERKMDDTNIGAWMDRNANLQRAMKIVLKTIYIRRELGTMNRKYNPQTTHFTMPHYSSVWKDIEVWRANLGPKQQETGGTKFIVMPEFPSSDKVPVREQKPEIVRTPEEVASQQHKDTGATWGGKHNTTKSNKECGNTSMTDEELTKLEEE